MIRPPSIDQRTASDITGQLHRLLKTYAPEWRSASTPGNPGDFGDALVKIFARFAEIVIERLNQAPQKNLLAYLDMLGASLQPPQPARVPLVFSLAAGGTADAIVPARTQAAAPPAAGETAPVIFETERDLVVVAATLDKVFARDPASYRFTDLLSAVVSGAQSAFTGKRAIDHTVYIGLDDLLGRGDLRELRLDFLIASGPSPPVTSPPITPASPPATPPLGPRQIGWSILDAADGTDVTPIADTTEGLRRSGQIHMTFQHPPAVQHRTVKEQQSRWLRGRLATPIAPADRAATGQVRVTRLTASADLSRQGLPIALAFANTAPLDVTKDFLPFGERPRLGDVLFLSVADTFGMAGADVTVKFQASPPSPPASPPSPPASPPATPPRPPTLKWEYWDGARWAELAGLSDGTAALKSSGDVKFRIGQHPEMLTVNGADGYWIRVRIAAGDYGQDARYIPDRSTTGYKYEPPSLAPPSIAAVTVEYTATLRDQSPDRILTRNEVADAVVADFPFVPFCSISDTFPTLYFGFALPDGQDFPNRPVSLFLGIDEPALGDVPDNPRAAEPARLVWECWTEQSGWQRCDLHDETRGLTHSGIIEFLAPAGFARQWDFGVERYWLRCRWEAGDFAFQPRLRRVVLNAVMAEHASTVSDETLGSSDGSPGQRFATAHRPILHTEEELWVREPDLPSADEQAALGPAGVGDAIKVTRDAAGRPIEIWVRWQEVADFYGSGPRHRHYVLDHIAGSVGFGDGANGLIPPPGAGNLRLTRFRTGGGSAGNRAADTIVQLTTTIPFVAGVTNPVPARGGADAETMDALLERGPRAIRHGDRAVTIEDFEDLAMLASPEVARAKCVALYDLLADPDAENERPGTVSVIIVPRSDEAKPLPSLPLQERIVTHLKGCCLPVLDLKVVGPDYRKIDVEAEVVLTEIDRASEVHARIIAALHRFLHPLTGGFDRAGWDFGRSPQKSDLLRLMGEIPGIDHVRSVKMTETPDRKGATSTARSLVYAGAFKIAVAAASL